MPGAIWAKIGVMQSPFRIIKMNINSILDHIANAILLVAAITVPFAFVELAAQFLGKSLTNGFYSPGRIIELTAMLLTFAIAIWLRQIHIALKSRD